MLAFPPWVKNAVIGFVSIFGAVFLRLRDFDVLAFPAWVKNTVIGLVSIFSAVLYCFRDFDMFTLTAWVEVSSASYVSLVFLSVIMFSRQVKSKI